MSATRTRPYVRSLQEVRAQVGNASTRNLGAQIQALRVVVTARQGAALLQVSALVTWANQASLPASLAAAPETGTSATGTSAAASSGGQAQPPAVPANAANSLRYPFTVLEISESTPSLTPPPPDAPAARS